MSSNWLMAAGSAGIPFGEDVPFGEDIHYVEDVLRKGCLGQRAGVHGEAFWEGDGD